MSTMDPDAVRAILATIAAHAHANDDGRVDDLVALYTADCTVEVGGLPAIEGADRLRAMVSQLKPDAQRHLFMNTVVTSTSETESTATSDMVFISRDESGWAVRAVARCMDTFRYRDGSWLIHRRRTEFMAP